jgi:GAF domain-containing protein
VANERRTQILAQLTGGHPSEFGSQKLCQVSASVTQMSGAGIMLMSGDFPAGSLCTTDAISARIEELQYTLGEGPCVDAHVNDRPTFEPNLLHPLIPRWVAFTGPALAAGVRAVFGFPLRVGAVRLGALNLYRTTAGDLTDDQHADALVMADVVAQAVLVLQSRASPGELANGLATGSNFQYVVHQASGMVAAQLSVSVGHALVLLRAYAFANERSLGDIASDVVARTLRLPESRL